MVDFAAIQAVPAGTANGTPLPNVPINARGVVLYIPAAAGPPSVAYAVASAQPTSAPTAVTIIGNAAGATIVLTEGLNPGQNLYIVTAGTSGSSFFRWLQGG